MRYVRALLRVRGTRGFKVRSDDVKSVTGDFIPSLHRSLKDPAARFPCNNTLLPPVRASCEHLDILLLICTFSGLSFSTRSPSQVLPDTRCAFSSNETEDVPPRSLNVKHTSSRYSECGRKFGRTMRWTSSSVVPPIPCQSGADTAPHHDEQVQFSSTIAC